MIMIKMIKTRIPIAMGTTPPRMPFASSLFAPVPCVLWSKQKAQAPLLTHKDSPATSRSDWQVAPWHSGSCFHMMPFTTDDGPATACLVVRSWQERLDLPPGVVRQLAPSGYLPISSTAATT